MRITINIDEDALRDVQRLTRISKKSPAVSKAIAEYLREVRKHDLIRRVREGHTDYAATNDELEASARYDAH
jgi:Arc/MetJ family transcription regulator